MDSTPRPDEDAPAEGDALLDAYPCRAAVDWDLVDGRVVIAIQRTPSRFEAWLRRFLPGPEARFLTLDELGTEAWVAADGSHTVREIASRLRDRHKEAAEPAESRAATFVTQLWRRGLLRVFDAPAPGGDDHRGFPADRGYVRATCGRCGKTQPMKARPGARYVCPACGRLAQVPRE